MFYVYILNSLTNPNRLYIGYTHDIENRLKDHNYGDSVYTKAYAPWRLMTYIAFDDKDKAIAFEKYLKSGSGRSFSKKHL